MRRNAEWYYDRLSVIWKAAHSAALKFEEEGNSYDLILVNAEGYRIVCIYKEYSHTVKRSYFRKNSNMYRAVVAKLFPEYTA